MKSTTLGWSHFERNFELVKKRLAKQEANSYRFWFRKKYNLPPKDERFLQMEDWECELEFYTYDAHEKAVGGTSTEEYEVDKTAFEDQLKEFNSQFSPNEDEWEIVDDGQE
jgi:hypothetical protein